MRFEEVNKMTIEECAEKKCEEWSNMWLKEDEQERREELKKALQIMAQMFKEEMNPTVFFAIICDFLQAGIDGVMTSDDPHDEILEMFYRETVEWISDSSPFCNVIPLNER